MAKVTLHPMLLGISGKIGSIVFYSYRNNQYARRYVIPKNPNTPAQKSRRELFAEAVNKWQNLPEHKKSRWNNDARNQAISGYNLFISVYLGSKTPSEEEKTGISDAILLYQIRSHSVYDKRLSLSRKSRETAPQSSRRSTIRVESQTCR
jgi:hypothetical protein